MGKRNRTPSTESNESTQAPVPTYHAPSGYEKRTDDVKGFWDFNLGPLHFIPMRAILTDGSIDEEKPSALIIGSLVDRTTLVAEAADIETGEAAITVVGEPGDLVGLWGKPGMREVRNLAGVKTFIAYTGEKDVGKQNPMKMFDVLSPDVGRPLPVEDKRDKSRHARHWLIPEARADDEPRRGRGRTQNRRSSREDDYEDAF